MGTGRARRAVGYLLAAVLCVAAARAAAEEPFERGRIPHRDGSGRATIVEVQPGVPGGKELVRDDDDRPAPKRGEISLPSPTPPSTPTAAATPRRY
ncbi:MAG TPA: hypothetical protein VGK30_00110 [Candidatus Binatia bacterium]|jgi:hypothetical protein